MVHNGYVKLLKQKPILHNGIVGIGAVRVSNDQNIGFSCSAKLVCIVDSLVEPIVQVPGIVSHQDWSIDRQFLNVHMVKVERKKQNHY